MDPPRLAALAIDVAIHPIAAGRLFAALGLNVARLADSVELRLDDGVVVRLTQTTTPSRVGLTFAVRDLGEVAKALDSLGIEWTVTGPDVIRVERQRPATLPPRGRWSATALERGALKIDVTELETGHTGLVAVTMFVTDVNATAKFWRVLGMTVPDADAPDEPAADVGLGGVDVWLKNCAIRLRDRAAAPATVVHMVLRSADPMSSTPGLDHAGWPYERDGDSTTTQTPDGCGIRVTPERRGADPAPTL
jgi:catechol 2,3-dioxygenase-like lactoylglutathione lyase family enzyme